MVAAETNGLTLSPALRARLDKPISYRQMTVPLRTTYWKSFQKSLRKGRVRELRSQARKKDWRGGTIWVFSMAPYMSASWNELHISQMGNGVPNTLTVSMTNRSNSASDPPRCLRMPHARCPEPKSRESVRRV